MSHHHHHHHHHSHRGERKVVPTSKMELDEEMDGDEEEERSRCSACLSTCRQVTTFLLSHVGLISLVVGYCIMGAFTFEALESAHEMEVKRNMTQVREAVTKFLWTMTKDTPVIEENKWVLNATKRLQDFETELLRAMKKGGWDGSENENSMQWTFSGALFYSIVVITTIGYGHISPKTVWGKVVTIFYAILGIPLMLLCLSHIGDFMANAFRFLYWKVCCFMCTRRQRPAMRRHPGTFRRSRSLRASASTKHPGNPRGMKRSNIRRSARISQRSADSAFSDPSTFSIPDTPIRRVHSDDDLRVIPAPSTVPRLSPPHLRPYSHPRYNTFHAHQHQRSSRSAEPAYAQSARNLPVLFNKYAEDAIITDECEIRKGTPRTSHIKPLPDRDRFYVEDYWDEDADEYVYGTEEEPKKAVPILLCLLLVLSYILFGAVLFSGWENWDFLDSAYFCFITLTTIGFGDFVPATRVQNNSAEVSIALCSLYLLFGISLLAMSFNLVQEEVINSVKQVGMRLGIIREEEN